MRKVYLGVTLILAMLLAVTPVVARPAASSGTTHVVLAGETLFSIARYYGLDVDTLARANGIVNPNVLYAGQVLVIPTESPEPVSNGGVYIVQPGDTLLSIALRLGVNMWDLARLNSIFNPNTIYVGQKLVVPGTQPQPQPQPQPTAQPSPAATRPAPTTVSGWRGAYYQGTDPTGEPLFVRTDAAINFHWGETSPDVRLNTDGFSVHWTRTINFRGGVYRFQMTADDGTRIWIDGQVVLDEWHTQQPAATYTKDVTLTPGRHLVAVDYYDESGTATAQFTFRRLGDAVAPTPTPAPSAQPTAAPQTDLPGDAWLGEYFTNMELRGQPAFTRRDPAIGFEWGSDSPAPGIPGDYFGVRWSRVAPFYADDYIFCARADDGIRLYLDQQLVIDEWHSSKADRNYCHAIDVTKGIHTITVQYYEYERDALAYVWWERH